MAPIYEKIQSLGLPVTFHAGWDPLSPEVVHAEPERLARVLDAFPRMTVIGAHLGGLCRYDQVEKFLLGRRNLYLDTAMTAPYLEDEAQYGRILRGHGLDRAPARAPPAGARGLYPRGAREDHLEERAGPAGAEALGRAAFFRGK